MPRIKIQFLVSFAVIGSVMPLLPVVLQKVKGFSLAEVGTAMALMSVASLLSPVIATVLADTRYDSRKILALSLFIGALALGVMTVAIEPWIVMAMCTFLGLAIAAVFPLQDGYYFSAARAGEAAGHPVVPYPRVRVWGTVGFIVPSIALFIFMKIGYGTTVALSTGAVAAFASAATALFLLRPLNGGAAPGEPQGRGLPSTEAARRLFGKHGLAFSIALALGHFAVPIYNAYFPIYLTDISKIDEAWVAPVLNYGILLEVFFTLAMPWLLRRLGVRRLFVLGFVVMAARLFVLASHPPFFVVFLAQSFHGLEIIALYILPVIFIDRLADDRFRNSVQGVYAMLVAGVPKVLGYQVAGQIADSRLVTLFVAGGIIATLAALVVALFLPSQASLDSKEAP